MRAFIGGCMITFLAVGFALAGGSAPTKDDIPKYIKTLSSTSAKSGDRVTAANMIAKRGNVHADDVVDAVDPLRKVAEKDKDVSVRKAAMAALGSIGPEDTKTIPLLVSILKNDSSKDIKFSAVYALERFGVRAKKDAMPAIRDFRSSLDKKEQRMLKDAIKAIEGGN